MNPVNELYRIQPDFLRDILQIHFFKTYNYYESRMNAFPKLKISNQLKFTMSFVENTTSYSKKDGKYQFELKLNFMFLPQPVEFPVLFNTLIKSVYEPNDIEDMYNMLYSSENPILVKFAEKMKSLNIAFSAELFDFVKRRECDAQRNWKTNDFITGEWDYTLLALNNRVWETAFEKHYFNDLFINEMNELENIDAGNFSSEKGYNDHLTRIDLLIKNKLNDQNW
jgi:hypothetical protein